MQQLACHLLSTAAMVASTPTTTSTTTSTIAAAAATAINYRGHSKILHLLGPPWTRTFRCIWMLEEMNEEYYQQHPHQNTQSNDDDTDQVTHATATASMSSTPPQVPYYLIYNAKPLSVYVKKFHSTGKVPVLLEYNTNQDQEDDVTSDSGTPTNSTSILDDHNVFVLSEASAINTYLYDQYGLYSSINKNRNTEEPGAESIQAHPLVPPVGSPLRGQYDAVISCICTELDAQGLWMHRKHEVMSEQLTGSRPNQRAVQHAKDHFKRINTYLAFLCNPYLLGAHFTAADILYIHCLQWSQSIGWSNDTWPTIDVLPPIHVDLIREQLRNAATNPSSSDNLSTPPPSVLQPYLDLCLSRPAYQRAVQIRDHREDGRNKDTNHNFKPKSTSTTNTGEVSMTTASLLEQWEHDQNHVERRKNVRPPPKSKL